MQYSYPLLAISIEAIKLKEELNASEFQTKGTEVQLKVYECESVQLILEVILFVSINQKDLEIQQ